MWPGIQIPVKTIALTSIFFLVHCTPQVRNDYRIQKDAYLKYSNPDFDSYAPEVVITTLSHLDAKDRTFQLNDLGIANARQNQLDQAEFHLRSAIQEQDGSLLPYLNLARLYIICDEVDESRKVFTLMANDRNLDVDLIFKTADDFLFTNRATEAEFLMKALNESGRGKRKSAFWLGENHFNNGRDREALEFFEMILEENPSDSEALFNTAYIYYLNGVFDRAADYLSAARKSGSQEKYLCFYISDSFYRIKELKQALKNIRQCEIAEEKEKILNLEGRIMLALDYHADLRPLLRQVQDPEVKKRLLETWFGDSDIRDLPDIYDEFEKAI